MRRILRWPPPEADGSEWSVGCLFRPSFHPECAVFLVLREGSASLVVRSVNRSIWTHVNALAGGPTWAPAVDHVEPAVASEELALSQRSVVDLRTELDALVLTASADGGLGIDGMPVQASRFGPAPFTVPWRAGDPGDAEPFVRSIHTLALATVRWDASTRALQDVATYL